MPTAAEFHGNKRLAAGFGAHRRPLAEALFQVLRNPNCGAGELPPSFDELDDWARGHFYVAVDLAAAWFSGEDEYARHMFLGWVYSQLAEPAARVEDQTYRPGCVLDHAAAAWSAVLEPHIGASAVQVLAEQLEPMVQRLKQPATKKLKILFLGDCLMSEIMTALAGYSVDAGIDFTSVYLHKQVPAVLRNEIRALRETDFDLVFFSPFSHRFTADYEVLQSLKAATWPRARFFSTVDQILRDVEITLKTLIDKVSCPIYVHNTTTAMTVPPRRLRRYALYLATMKNRHDARVMINARAAKWPEEPPFEGRVRLLDEEALTGQARRIELGRLTSFQSQEGMFHPTRLGLELARGPYIEAIASAAFLHGKKVVVCDLDNTLWDGVIGEGAVKHFLERQQTLAKLKQRGVLLSINSKNDPANVHFTGAALRLEDFVAPHINWQPKSANMASIASLLNLKTKDFVFIDDRPDELERIRETFPEMVVLNACEPRTWQWMSQWQKHMVADELEDRTKLYHERAAREQFLGSERESASSAEDEQAALERLGLSVRLELVSGKALKRAAELINRTNQFNMAGSRTTLEALQHGLGTDHWVVTATVSDKFGDMGVVGVMRVDRTPEGLSIPIFVLSCRVFGMGIEFALLNSVRELAAPEAQLTGQYRETQHNKPGRHLYEQSGLVRQGDVWVGRVADLPADPAWLKVDRQFAAVAAARV